MPITINKDSVEIQFETEPGATPLERLEVAKLILDKTLAHEKEARFVALLSKYNGAAVQPAADAAAQGK